MQEISYDIYMFISLIIPSFIAGIITFLAPCTLPLVPGYLGFISGVSLEELHLLQQARSLRNKIIKNAIFYILGFSIVFIILGTVFAIGGAFLVPYRLWLAKIGGFFVLFFGLFMLGVLDHPIFNFLKQDKKFNFAPFLQPGKPISSFIFGATFAFGWTPCIGPILGTVLLLASTLNTIWQGTFLLIIFSLGLALPFMLVAIFISQASIVIRKMKNFYNISSKIGGIFLLLIGLLLISDNFNLWVAYFYQVFGFINYNRLLDFL